MQPANVSIYRNAIEPLAAEEIERQMQSLSEDIIKSLDKGEAIAYALNCLPPLYATTQEGWHWQQQRARERNILEIIDSCFERESRFISPT